MPEYYPTDCEAEIFDTYKKTLRSHFCRDCRNVDLVELGAGDGQKTQILIEELLSENVNFRYIPVDIPNRSVRKSLALRPISRKQVNRKYMKAIWNGKVLAESDDTINVEGNPYFPVSSINRELFKPSDTHTVCHWKGTAFYYDLDVDGEVNRDAVWYYPDPSDLASGIKDHVSFWRGVEFHK